MTSVTIQSDVPCRAGTATLMPEQARRARQSGGGAGSMLVGHGLAAGRPMSGLLLPATDLLIAKRQSSRAQIEMLLAAIAVAESGPDVLADIRDPFGDGPFVHRPLKHGFELQSALSIDGKPLTLKFGRDN